jgi:hypothetical protein
VAKPKEGDEERRVIDIHVHRLAVGILRLLEREREVEREQTLVVVERIILRRLQRKIVAVPDMDEGEIIELLEGVDVHFGEGLELLGREDAVDILVEALHRHVQAWRMPVIW